MTAVEITAPGVYDIPADIYHADPVPGESLSSTGARKLTPPSCPARFRWDTDNPPEPKPEFDIGSAAHKLVLGAGADLVVVDAVNWQTKKAKEQREEARAAGRIPVLAAEHRQVQAMAAQVRRHRTAGALFNPLGRGRPEQALFWQDPQTGVWRRAMLDWLPDPSGGRLLLADYKTTRAADIESIRKAIANYGYHQQAAWYLDGVHALGLAEDAAFLFVFQEKTPPYLIQVVELDTAALRIGRERNRQALEIYRDCREAGVWPGYPDDDIPIISLPAWAETRHLQETW